MQSISIVRLLAGLLVLLTALAPMAASAEQPTIQTEAFHRSPNPYIKCDTFDIRGEFDVERTVITYYDQDGTPVRQVFHIRVTGEVINAVPGASLPATREGTFTVDLVGGTTIRAGQTVMAVAPGEGVVLQEAGRLVRGPSGELLFAAGPAGFADYLGGDPSGVQDLCAALA